MLVAVLVVGSLFSAPVTAATDGSYLSITSVSTSPENPEPGESFVLTTTIENLQESEQAVTITDVYVRTATGLNEKARIEDVGAVGAGGSMEIPLSVILSEAKSYNLRVTVIGETAGGDRVQRQYPVYVDVEERAERVDVAVSAEDPVRGDESSLNVTVSNGGTADISGLELVTSADRGTVTNERRVSPSLDAGTERTFTYDVTFDQSGSQPVETTVSYTTSGGDDRTVTETTTVPVDTPSVNSEIEGRVNTNDSDSTVRAELSNFGNVKLTDVVVNATTDTETIGRKLVSDLAPDESNTVSFDTGDIAPGTVTLSASYDAAGETHNTSTTIDYTPSVEGEIRLTGTEVVNQNGTLTITGDASNIGETDISGVLVSVAGGQGVSPIAPSGEYFVGGVEASEFAVFELTARASGDVSSIPVRVEYIVDGERISKVVSVPMSSGSAGGPGGMPSGAQAGSAGRSGGPGGRGGGLFGSLGGLTLGPILTSVGAVLVAGAGGIFLWRRR
ncbi:S-layer domain (plasmid) [Haloferax volcanii]|nr:S-layer domain [Haloferax lucentense]